MARRGPLSRFEWACLALILLGFGVRLLVFRFEHVGPDGMAYLTMGKSLVEHGEFISPWLDPPVFSRHFPPAYPALDALAYSIGGPSFTAYAMVSIGVAAFLLGATFLTTLDLYGRARAFAATAIVSTSAILIDLDLTMLSESLIVALFALTIWALLRSLDDGRFVVFAGLFAGLAYLTKASMGPFFILAGLGGFLWRFYYVRFRVFRDVWYMIAAGIFALFVFFWAGRNVLRHGWPNWQTQPHADEAVAHLFSQPTWPVTLGLQFLWGAVVMLTLGLAFGPEIARSLRRIREERTSALWLAVLTPSVIGIIFAAAFSSLEGRPIVSDTTIRYLITPFVPVVWLGVRELDLDDRAPASPPTHGAGLLRARFTWLAVGAAILAFLHFANPTYPFLSRTRMWIYAIGVSGALLCLLAARRSAWRPIAREERPDQWRAVPRRLEGAPAILLVLAAFALALGLGIFILHAFLSLLVIIAASLAAGSPRARVIVLALAGAMVPLAGLEAPTDQMFAAEDVNALAAPGDAVAVERGHETFFYPFFRGDLDMVLRDKPHDWYIAYSGSGSPPLGDPDLALEREYTREFRAAPGAALSIALWGGLLGDAVEIPAYVDVRLYRVIDPAEAAP